MSTQVTINDVEPKTQIIATSGQTVFSTNWTANAASDVVVYARADGESPDDLTQIIDTSDYSVAFVGADETVEVTFSSGRTLDDIVTIVRNTPADRLNLYTNTNFTASMLNQDIGILTLVDQQAQLYNNQVAPHYNLSATPDLGDDITGEGGDIYLPVLEANQFWVKNADNTAIEAFTLPDNDALPVTLPLITYESSDYLTEEQNLGALSTGVLYQTVASSSATLSVKSTSGSGDVVLNTSPTITTPKIAQINDANGNASLALTATASAVNYIRIGNNATGQPVYLVAEGSDTNIGMAFGPKGNGAIGLNTAAPTQPLIIYNGTSSQHSTSFAFFDTAASRIVTFPDATGTVALSGAAQDVIFNSVSWSDTTKGIVGTTTNNNAASGYVGETISNYAANVAFSHSTGANITSALLTPGDWVVSGCILGEPPGGQTFTYMASGVSTTSATLLAAGYYTNVSSGSTTFNQIAAVAPEIRVSVDVDTTVYLVVQGGFSGASGSGNAYGSILAERIR